MALIFFTLIPQDHKLAAASCSSRWRWDSVCVITCKHNTQDREAQGAWSTQLIGEGRWNRVDEKELFVWVCGRAVCAGLDRGSLDTRCTVLLTKGSESWVTLSVEETTGSYWAVGLALYAVAYRLATSHHVLPSPASGSSVPWTWGISHPE